MLPSECALDWRSRALNEPSCTPGPGSSMAGIVGGARIVGKQQTQPNPSKAMLQRIQPPRKGSRRSLPDDASLLAT